MKSICEGTIPSAGYPDGENRNEKQVRKNRKKQKQVQDSLYHVPPAPEAALKRTGTKEACKGICINIKELVV